MHGGFSTSIDSLPEGTLIKNRPTLGVDHLDLSPRNPTDSLLGVTSPVHRLTYRLALSFLRSATRPESLVPR